MNGTANGAAGPAELERLSGKFDFARAARLLALAVDEGERRLADARTVADQAAAVIRQQEDELRRLRRALAVLREAPALADPGPGRASAGGRLGRGSRVGGGVGQRAGTFILNAALERYRVSGDAGFTTGTMRVALKPFPGRTVQDGLTRLVQDGFVQRLRPGCYELTPEGLAQPPAATRDLLLPRPEPAEATP